LGLPQHILRQTWLSMKSQLTMLVGPRRTPTWNGPINDPSTDHGRDLGAPDYYSISQLRSECGNNLNVSQDCESRSCRSEIISRVLSRQNSTILKRCGGTSNLEWHRQTGVRQEVREIELVNKLLNNSDLTQENTALAWCVKESRMRTRFDNISRS